MPFGGPHTKPHGVRGLSNHYHMRFYPKLGHDICAIRGITCAYSECTFMLEKPWIPGLITKQQPRYRPVTNCSYWPFIGSFKKLEYYQIITQSKNKQGFLGDSSDFS